jgi:hypothetical protein
VHLLACRMRIAVDCERLAARLAPTLHHAVQRYPVARVHRFDVRRRDGRYRIEEDGAERTVEPSPQAAAFALGRRIHELALAALPEFTKVHAGCASWLGRQFLAVGPPRSGKTTLMARLLYEGFTVHGDELVLVRAGEALPYPRRFGVRPPTLSLVPQLLAFAGGTSPASKPMIVDPAQLGFDWTIAPAPVDAVFFLEPNHGGRTYLRPCPRYLMAQLVMSQSTPPGAGQRAWIRDVCGILDPARCYTLSVGDLDTAVAALKDGLRRSPTVAA